MREAGDSIGPRMGLVAGFILVALLAALATAPRSDAAFPGRNGLIAFDSFRTGSNDIFLMSDTGANPFRPFPAPAGALDLAPAWAPEGGTLAFASTRAGGGLDIWTADIGGTGLKDITPGSPSNDADPAWSFDGNLIVFETDATGDLDIAVTSSAGGPINDLTPDPPFDEMMSVPPITDQNPVFGVNSNRIFFQSDRDVPGQPQIYSMNVDGSDVRRLTNPPGSSMDPDISPDGTQVLFASDRLSPGGETDLFAMNTDGSNPYRVAGLPGFDFRPVYSPDGLRIAWTNFPPAASESNVYTMALDTTGLTALSPDPASDGNPDWQPARFFCAGEIPTIIGSSADESIVGTARDDVIVALGGADTVKGLQGNDVICGNVGRDIINGGQGDDILRGNKKADKLKGGAGADGLFGGSPKGKGKRKDPDVCRGGKGLDNVKGCG